VSEWHEAIIQAVPHLDAIDIDAGSNPHGE
jgi:hypothetical protein